MRRFTVPLTALALLASPAFGQSPRDLLFPRDQGCYMRHYDKAHLAKHPDQLVKDIAISPQAGPSSPRELVVRVVVRLRGNPEQLVGYGYCENTSGTLSCLLEGDMGWFQMKPAKSGATVSVGRDGVNFEGDTSVTQLGGGKSDDEIFALTKAPAGSCP